MTDYKQLCVELLDSAEELDDLIEGIRLGNYMPDSFTLQPIRAVLERARAALAEPEPEGPNNEPQIGDYVLATKWSDGDPCDHFCVGFFAGKDRDRYKVVDSDGNLFRGNGFRRCETITQKEGESILSLKIGDKPGPSVWWYLERIRGIEVQPEPEKPTDEEILQLSVDCDVTYSLAEGEFCAPWQDGYNMRKEVISFAWAVLARWGNHQGMLASSMPQPIPASERLPEMDDCDADGRCWVGYPVTKEMEDEDLNPSWELCQINPDDEYWLPANALLQPS